MNLEEAREAIVEAILDVAPDTDPSSLADEAAFREELGIDSMDFLDILEQVADETGVEVPEKDYPKVQTLADFSKYLSQEA